MVQHLLTPLPLHCLYGAQSCYGKEILNRGPIFCFVPMLCLFKPSPFHQHRKQMGPLRFTDPIARMVTRFEQGVQPAGLLGMTQSFLSIQL